MTVEEAHAAGHRDGSAGLGPITPRSGPPGSSQQRVREAYQQSYRDALIGKVGIPERRTTGRGQNPVSKKRKPTRRPRKAKRAAGKTVTTTTRATVIRRTNARKMIHPPKLGDTVSVYGHPAKVVKLLGMGTVEAERDGKRYRVSGFPLVSMPVYKPFNYTRRRRANRRPPSRALVVLYASKPGMRRLKYLGRGKFGERGRPMLFPTALAAHLAATILRDEHPDALRGWTLKAGA